MGSCGGWGHQPGRCCRILMTAQMLPRGVPLYDPGGTAVSHGRRRTLDAATRKTQQGLRGAHLSTPPAVADAQAATVGALLGIIGELNHQISELHKTL